MVVDFKKKKKIPTDNFQNAVNSSPLLLLLKNAFLLVPNPNSLFFLIHIFITLLHYSYFLNISKKSLMIYAFMAVEQCEASKTEAEQRQKMIING